MFDKNLLVTTNQYLQESKNWLKTVARKENLSIMFFPKTDRLRRIQQLLDDKETLLDYLGDSRYLFQFIDFDAHNIEDPKDVNDYIGQQLNISTGEYKRSKVKSWKEYLNVNSVNLVLILPQAEKYLTPEGKNALIQFSKFINSYTSNINVISLFEADFTGSQYENVSATETNLFQNFFYYPLYDHTDTRTFIGYLSQKWKYEIPEKTATKIIADCGGNFWFVKEAVRELVSKNRLDYDSYAMQFRLKVVFDSLTKDQQDVLVRLAYGKKTYNKEEKQIIRYFRKMRLTDNNNQILPKLFKQFINTHSVPKFKLELLAGKVVLNQIPLEGFFSRKELRVVKHLIENKNKLITRGEIAKAIWPVNTESQYSDWAIDQIIARVRKRFKELSLPPNIVQTKRGKGFIFNLP